MTFQKKGHIPFKGEMIKVEGQYFDDLKKTFFSGTTKPIKIKLG